MGSGKETGSAERGRARKVLLSVLEWKRPAAVWPAVAAAVEAVGTALRGGDPVALESAVAALELLSPKRVNRLSAPRSEPDPPGDPVDDETRDRVTIIVDDLDGGSPGR